MIPYELAELVDVPFMYEGLTDPEFADRGGL